MPPEDKSELIDFLLEKLIDILSTSLPDLQSRAARVIANFASFGKLAFCSSIKAQPQRTEKRNNSR